MTGRILAAWLIAGLAGSATLAAGPQARAETWKRSAENWRRDLDAPGQRGLIARTIQRNLDDPRVMADCRAGLCGAGLTPAQCAYTWAATAGCRHDFHEPPRQPPPDGFAEPAPGPNGTARAPR